MKKLFASVIILVISIPLFSQENLKKDKVVYKEAQNGFYQDSVLKGIDDFKSESEKPEVKTYIAADLSGKSYPTDPKNYTQYWHNPPLSQGQNRNLLELCIYILHGIGSLQAHRYKGKIVRNLLCLLGVCGKSQIFCKNTG